MDFEVNNLQTHYSSNGRGAEPREVRLRVKAPGKVATQMSQESCEKASRLNAEGKSFEALAEMDTWRSVDGRLRKYHWSQIERSVVEWRLMVAGFDR